MVVLRVALDAHVAREWKRIEVPTASVLSPRGIRIHGVGWLSILRPREGEWLGSVGSHRITYFKIKW